MRKKPPKPDGKRAKDGNPSLSRSFCRFSPWSGFEFKAKKPKVAVNEALGTLATKGVVKKVRNEGVANIWAKTGSAAA